MGVHRMQLAELFLCDVCTHHCAFDLRSNVVFSVIKQCSGETKVGDFCVETMIKKDVVGLDVSVNDGGVCELVQIGKTAGCTMGNSKPPFPIHTYSRLTCTPQKRNQFSL